MFDPLAMIRIVLTTLHRVAAIVFTSCEFKTVIKRMAPSSADTTRVMDEAIR